jgi:hypothetical protein
MQLKLCSPERCYNAKLFLRASEKNAHSLAVLHGQVSLATESKAASRNLWEETRGQEDLALESAISVPD